jgi:4-alpha-glucanotransferase
MVTATSHDLVPLAGYFDGTDLVTRRALGRLDDAALAAGLADRGRQRAALVARLAEEGLAAPAAGAPVAGAYRFLSRTPAPLVAVALDDLAGEREPINLPGVPVDDHPSGSRRMDLSLERISTDPALMPERLRPRALASSASPRPR